MEANAVVVRCVPGKMIAARAGNEEAIICVAFRRVPGEGVARRAGKVEAIAVVIRSVPGETGAGRTLKQEAVVESLDFAFLDRDFCKPIESNSIVSACASYSVPAAVERYTALTYNEPIP